MSGNTMLENTFSSGRKDDGLIIAVLLVFTLFFRLFLLQMINVGPDEIDYWFAAKQLVTGRAYPAITHRTIRWSIILPTAFFQLIFGLNPLIYYVTPILNSLVQTILMYFLGKKLFGRGVAFYSVLLFTAWPYMWRTGSQIRPAVFSITYVLSALYLLFCYLDIEITEPGSSVEISADSVLKPIKASSGKQISRWSYLEAIFKSHQIYLIGSVLFMFLAYQSKITNLYFLPGILILLWRYRHNIRDPLRYGLYLGGLYLLEHAAYFLCLGNLSGVWELLPETI